MDASSMNPEPLDVPRSQIGASPVWEAGTGRIVWVDVMAGLVHRHRPEAGETQTTTMPSPIGSIVPRKDAGYAMGLEDGFWIADQDLGSLLRIGAFHDPGAGIRMNAGKADGHGRFWSGTMAYDLRPGAGALGRLDPDRSISVHVDGLGEANGFGWSPDGRTFYLVDSGIGVIDAFDFDPDAGTLANRRTIVRVPREEGLTDGMTVDSDGFIWLSMWDGWSVRRYASDGRLDRTIAMPVAQVTGCTFGGDGLRDLYITSAAYQLAPEAARAQPLAGSLFVVRPGPSGLPAGSYAG
jgi:sugar lactone lactonase YvrE